MAKTGFVSTARARRFVSQSSVTKKMSNYQKDKLIRSIARMLHKAYQEGIVEGRLHAQYSANKVSSNGG